VAAALAAGMVFVAGVSLISIRRGKKVTYEVTCAHPFSRHALNKTTTVV